MNVYLAEFVGTFLLVLLGNGVVANVLLDRTKGHGGGWIVVTAGWGVAVFVAVLAVKEHSGAHINPAVSVGLAAAGRFDWALVPGYVGAQLVGAGAGAAAVWRLYRHHYEATDGPDLVLATFCTAPNIRATASNLASEIAGTFVLVFAVLASARPTVVLDGGTGGHIGLGSLGALPVALVVFAIGLGLGGTTGYAINPARDLGPRVAHALLPIPGKRDSEWDYAWVPVVGPLLGALLAAICAGAGMP